MWLKYVAPIGIQQDIFCACNTMRVKHSCTKNRSKNTPAIKHKRTAPWSACQKLPQSWPLLQIALCDTGYHLSFSTVLRGCSRPLRLHFSTTCTAFSFPSLLCTRPHSSPIQAYRCHPAKRELLSFTLLCNNSNFGTQAYFSYLFFCSFCAFRMN